jgi:hypothetical protein
MNKFGSHFVVSHGFVIGEFFKYSDIPFIQMFHPYCCGYRANLIICFICLRLFQLQKCACFGDKLTLFVFGRGIILSVSSLSGNCSYSSHCLLWVVNEILVLICKLIRQDLDNLNCPSATLYIYIYFFFELVVNFVKMRWLKSGVLYIHIHTHLHVSFLNMFTWYSTLMSF